MSTGGPDERAVIRASWSAKLNPGGILAGFAFASSVIGFFAPDATIGARVAWLLATILGLGLLVRCLVRPALVLSSHGVKTRGVVTTRAASWNEVLALSFRHTATRAGVGQAAHVWTVPGVPSPSVPILVEDAPTVARAFVERFAPHVPVNPAAPWRDRQGVWRGVAEGDPIESMQTVRRASVGPWSIDVRVFGDGFEAITTLVDGGGVVRSAPRRATLAEAVADGIAQVRAAQAEL